MSESRPTGGAIWWVTFIALAYTLVLPGTSESVPSSDASPNILVILADDVGWADVSLDSRPGVMPTPEINRLCNKGTVIENYYTQSTCTPSRASLLTGRYATNTGLNFAMLPGAVSGLPDDMMTLPRLLRNEKNYEAHMVGKWHLGHSQWKQTPVGKGFQTHVGSLLWSMEYWTKQIWQEPWNPLVVDWVRANENGTYSHYLEERHTTEALTEEAIQVMERHALREDDKPLFLYLAYTAAHAPLVPLVEDERPCRHLKHEWRRKFCGLIVGLDRAVGRVVNTAANLLGSNTIIFFTSDNGGAPFFGGLNYPLRSGKTTPFEGGVKVPACIADLTENGRYFGMGPSSYAGLMHVSDLLPTFASAAGINQQIIDNLELDGHDLTLSIREGEAAPRNTMLLEMYYGTNGEFMFPNEDVVAYRKGKWKIIQNTYIRDAHWYYEPDSEYINNTDVSYATTIGESVIKFLEGFSGPGPFDTIKDLIVHVGIHSFFQRSFQLDKTLLFDMEADPYEQHNLAEEHPDIILELMEDISVIRDARPPQQKFWMTIDRDKHWESTVEKGFCNPRIVPRRECVFAHPWIADDVDLESIELVYGADSWPFIRNILSYFAPYIIGIVAIIVALCMPQSP